MGTGKERLRRWRERNRAEGKQSFTIMLSQEAKEVLREEKEISGASYSTTIEQALLNAGKTVGTPVTVDHRPERAKILIDEDGILLRGEIERKEENREQIPVEDNSQLSEGFIPRLLKRSSSRSYKLKK
ncbi:MAG: hypothetical protein E4H15_02640 [Syntrophobacterales bacterium]|nr:MAG: hypothetical protein E4H15_02640 [Syntrophobacterales bacterium]